MIAVYDSRGCVGRCDATCHAARAGSKCVCICGGRNHGAGLRQALANVADEHVGLRPDDLARFCAARDCAADGLDLYDMRGTSARRVLRARRRAARELARAGGRQESMGF